MTRLGVFAASVLAAAVSASGQTSGRAFYVDAVEGDDGAAGSAPSSAWRSLERVNRETFQPGDRILFRSGGVWKGQLAPKGSGEKNRPIVIDQYGGEVHPILNGGGEVEDTLLLRNVQHWEVRNLEITNRGGKPAVRRGVHLLLQDFGEAHHIYLRNLVVHDVNGDNRKKDNGGILWRIFGDRKLSRFVDLRIEHCFVTRVDRSGIAAYSTHWDRRKWFPSLQVAIRHNVVDDTGGDGITPWASDGAVVEHNLVSNASRRADDYNAGIWPWSCDNTVIQFNEAYLVRGTKDGQGFDSDWNSRNTVIQYNYSHDNEGGFLLICDDGSQRRDLSIGNVGTVVRYNISRNDRARIFHVPGPVRDTKIYNNTVYIGKGLDVQAVLFSNWNGWAANTQFFNNIFFAEGTARYGHEGGRNPDGSYRLAPGFAPARDTLFEANLFFGNHLDRPQDTRAIEADPLFERPGAAERGWRSALGYRLRPGSPAIGRGRIVEGGGERDYWGAPVPKGRRPDLGALRFMDPAASDRIGQVRGGAANPPTGRQRRTNRLVPPALSEEASDRRTQALLALALREHLGLCESAYEEWLASLAACARVELTRRLGGAGYCESRERRKIR